jgi:hypothetical protein
MKVLSTCISLLCLAMANEASNNSEAYFHAIFMTTSRQLATNSSGGLFYKSDFATSRTAVSTQCKIHCAMLTKLLEITQVPQLAAIKEALRTAFSIWSLKYDVEQEAKGIKIMLKLVSDSARNLKDGKRTADYMITLINNYKTAPKCNSSCDDDTTSMPLPSPSPSPRRDRPASSARKPSLGHLMRLLNVGMNLFNTKIFVFVPRNITKED